MAICFVVFAIIVGDFSNENIHSFQNHLTQTLSALSAHRAGNLLVYNKKSTPKLNACLTHGSGSIQNILN